MDATKWAWQPTQLCGVSPGNQPTPRLRSVETSLPPLHGLPGTAGQTLSQGSAPAVVT